MNENRTQDGWETFVRETAEAFPFPPTPDIAANARGGAIPPMREIRVRRWAWAAMAVLAVTVGLLAAVPSVRAGVLEVLRIGAVRILPPEATGTPIEAEGSGVVQMSVTTTPVEEGSGPQVVTSVLELSGETTLAEAQAGAGFPIQAPTYPPDPEPPDKVFLQEFGGPIVVLVWLDPDSPDEARMSLHQLGPGALAQKQAPVTVQETTVNRTRAAWTEGPYLLLFETAGVEDYALARLVEGHVLVWEAGGVTYRLETRLSLAEAVKVAESLAVISQEDGSE